MLFQLLLNAIRKIVAATAVTLLSKGNRAVNKKKTQLHIHILSKWCLCIRAHWVSSVAQEINLIVQVIFMEQVLSPNLHFNDYYGDIYELFSLPITY